MIWSIEICSGPRICAVPQKVKSYKNATVWRSKIRQSVWAPGIYVHSGSAKAVAMSLSVCFNGHFPGEPGLAGIHWSKGWWRWWWQLDYWSYKLCKAPAKSSPPRNQHPVFYRSDALPVAHPTVSKHWRKKITFHRLAYPKLTWGSSNFSLWALIAPGYLGRGLPCLSSALSCQYPCYVNRYSI